MTNPKKGIILNNIGTPQGPDPESVGKYLKEFLMDEEILNMPAMIRYALVHFVIVPRRKRQSAAKYQKIWTEKGSPLLQITNEFAEGIKKALGDKYLVSVGMRYGEPSLEKSLESMHREGVQEVLLAPLYPQYARATCYSVEKKVQSILNEKKYAMKLKVLKPFYKSKKFIEPAAELLKNELKKGHWEHVMFSFHGLPESQIKNVPGCSLNQECCEKQESCENNCYRAQCFATAKSISQEAGLPKEHYSVCFQSRVGPKKWIGPASVETIRKLADRGFRRVLVQAPSFVADCLETLEEISIELRREFIKEGGEDLMLLPCQNADENWIGRFAEILKRESAAQ